MKLNIGCHTKTRPGWVNIDKDTYPGVDMISDAAKIALSDNSCSIIYASNILEHYPHTQTVDVLKEWHRLLRPGGILEISVPDFDRAIFIYKRHGLCDWVVNFLYGDQVYDGANHYAPFNEARLRTALEKAGFSDISRVTVLPNALEEDCSMLLSDVDYKYVCLNMLAIKV